MAVTCDQATSAGWEHSVRSSGDTVGVVPHESVHRMTGVRQTPGEQESAERGLVLVIVKHGDPEP